MASEIQKIHNDLKNKKITCVELIRTKLDKLEKNTHNSVNYLLKEQALEKAVAVDKKIEQGIEIRLLEGVPFGVKDVYLLQGEYASASSDMLKKYKSPYTATAIQKLIDAGAIPIVKENCDAYGHGSSSENTVFGAVKNAQNAELVAGGSSGGSAVNVAKGYTTFSIGGDTGGSIRQPAGYNQIYGLKPTYGRISRYGLMAYASSTDCVGPLSKSLEDIILLLNTMEGKDIHDLTTFDTQPVTQTDVDKCFNDKKIKIGYYKPFIENDIIDPKIKTDFLKLTDTLKNNGIEVEELDFFAGEVLVSTYYVLAMAETASNLARLDGVVYGSRIEETNLKESYAVTRSTNFTQETKRRIVGGNQVLSQGFSEAIYLKAKTLRNNIIQRFEQEFKHVDLILSPVSPIPPSKIGSTLNDPLAMYFSDAYTVGFSLGGLPTLNAPFGTQTGVQITAAKRKEKYIFKFAQLLSELKS